MSGRAVLKQRMVTLIQVQIFFRERERLTHTNHIGADFWGCTIQELNPKSLITEQKGMTTIHNKNHASSGLKAYWTRPICYCWSSFTFSPLSRCAQQWQWWHENVTMTIREDEDNDEKMWRWMMQLGFGYWHASLSHSFPLLLPLLP